MAKDIESKKRKASVHDGGADILKKVKKVTTEVTIEKKRKASEEPPISVKKSKKPKPALEESKPKSVLKKATSDKSPKETSSDSAKKVKSAVKELKSAIPFKTEQLKEPKPFEPSSDVEGSNKDSESDDEVDDQTEALLKGFESDGDDEDAENGGGLKEGDEVPTVPNISNRSKKQISSAAIFKKDNRPGVVYVGRIPHGFFEHEMREYFEQFGTILKLRLSRNRSTGASRHKAWIQFESSTVAEIVAKTMDNYLLFNHILKVKLVPNDSVPEKLWKGANRRFKKVPWNKIEGRKLAAPKSEDAWEKKNEKEKNKREQKADKLKAIGYEFDAPELKTAKGVAKPVEQIVLKDSDKLEAIEDAPVLAITQEVIVKEKRDKKGAATKKVKVTKVAKTVVGGDD